MQVQLYTTPNPRPTAPFPAAIPLPSTPHPPQPPTPLPPSFQSEALYATPGYLAEREQELRRLSQVLSRIFWGGVQRCCAAVGCRGSCECMGQVVVSAVGVGVLRGVAEHCQLRVSNGVQDWLWGWAPGLVLG